MLRLEQSWHTDLHPNMPTTDCGCRIYKMRIHGESVRRKLPLPLIGAVVLIALCSACYGVVWSNCLGKTGGNFVYGIDDPYIHLAIARNFSFHGVWGVTEYANSASSSSPLWVVLLCIVFRIAGDWSFWPFIFGVASSFAACILVYSRFLRAGISMPLSVLASCFVFAASPMHLLPFIGMEHCLQIFLDLVFVFWLMDKLDRPTQARDLWVGLTLTFLMCLCRYEGAFLVVIPFFVLLWKRDWRLAGVIAIGPALAVGGFGLFAHFMGMPWLPNSIVLKGTTPALFSGWWFQDLYLHLRGRSLPLSDLFVLCVIAGLALRFRGLRESTGSLQVLVWTIVSTCLMQSSLAAVGIFYRYEAYLLALMTVALVLFTKELATFSWPKGDTLASKAEWLLAIVVVIVGLFLLTPVFWFYQLGSNLIVSVYIVGIASLVVMETGPKTRLRLIRSLALPPLLLGVYFSVRDRATLAYNEIPNAVSDVYLQQYQMARFVSRYYRTGRLVANDIGCLSYFPRVHMLDLWGLASNKVRELKLAGVWNTATMKEQIELFKPDLAIVYPQWYRNAKSLPTSLIPVGSWSIPAVTSAGRPVVMFYAPNEAAAGRLLHEMMEFQPTLPTGITVLYGKEAIRRVPKF